MSVTLLPVIGCQAGCVGCYMSEFFRQNGNRPDKYHVESMKRGMSTALMEAGSNEVLFHGGEPTLACVDDLAELCEHIAAIGGTPILQTNAMGLTDEHYALFKRYKIGIGVSVNGPEELNRDRRVGNVANVVHGPEMHAATDRMTRKVHSAIERMVSEGISVGLICVLSQTNVGTDENLERVITWAADFGERLGIWNFRFNMLGQNDMDKDIDVGLGPRRASDVYLRLCEAAFADDRRIWNPFREMERELFTDKGGNCWLKPCDPWHTAAVDGILGDGSRTNCGRPEFSGIGILRTDAPLYWRQQVLESIPFYAGGCGGCRYWEHCHGGCPGEAIDGDVRQKSRYCAMYWRTYEYLERRGNKGAQSSGVPSVDVHDRKKSDALETAPDPTSPF